MAVPITRLYRKIIPTSLSHQPLTIAGRNPHEKCLYLQVELSFLVAPYLRVERVSFAAADWN